LSIGTQLIVDLMEDGKKNCNSTPLRPYVDLSPMPIVAFRLAFQTAPRNRSGERRCSSNCIGRPSGRAFSEEGINEDKHYAARSSPTPNTRCPDSCPNLHLPTECIAGPVCHPTEIPTVMAPRKQHRLKVVA